MKMMLRMGVDSDSPSKEEVARRERVLRETVEHYLPDFAREVKVISRLPEGREKPWMSMHQDSFAADYHKDEYTILGMAVKYAGLFNVSVLVVGKNKEFTK